MESLYYECHVTIEPVTGERENLVRNLGEICHFRLAEFGLVKPNRVDSFLTTRNNEFPIVRRDMSALIYILQRAGIAVWRYKIELAMVDSDIDNLFGLPLARPPGAKATPQAAVESGQGDVLDTGAVP